MDLRQRENICNFSFHNQKITSLHFLQNKQLIASSDTTVKLIDFSGTVLWKELILGREKLSIPITTKYGNVTDMELNGGNFVVGIFP